MIPAPLREVLGDDALASHAPLELEGAKLEATLRPTDAAGLARTLRVCAAESLGLLIRSGGTRLTFANAPCRARFLLDVTGLAVPPEIDREDGVARLSAGSSLASVREALAGSGWELPLESHGDGSVGGTLATALPSLRFGSPRDFVLGMDVALSSGERVKFGGRVVKNVTGYDLNKLFTGSCGTLGVIESAWLRLCPVPETLRTLEVEAPAMSPAEILAACRRASVRFGAVIREGNTRRFALELAGDEAAVDSDAPALEESGLEVVPQAEVAAPTDPGALENPAAMRVRVTSLPTAWNEAADILTVGGARVVALPARGLVYGDFALPEAADERAIGLVWQLARLAAKAGQGSFVVEAAPLAARAGREVFGDPGETVPLQRAIKRQYDPAGILNPGRFAGGA